MNPSQGTIARNTQKRSSIRWLLLALSLLTILALAAACGGGDTGDGESETASEVGQEPEEKSSIPTMPAPRFAAPTTMIDATKVAETESETTPEPDKEPDLAFGEEAYAKLCAECHGAAGEGVADKGESIVGLVSDHVAFDDLLRAGGGYGNDHIFGPSKISDDGIASLLAYVQTLTDK